MKEINVKVVGMMCEGCENVVKNTLKNIAGVNEVLASYKDGFVKVIGDENLSSKDIVDAIENVGYEVVND